MTYRLQYVISGVQQNTEIYTYKDNGNKNAGNETGILWIISR